MEKLINKLSKHIIGDFGKSDLLFYYIVRDGEEIIIDKDEMKISFRYVLARKGMGSGLKVETLSGLAKKLERLLKSSFDGQIFEGELGYYRFKIFEREIAASNNLNTVDIYIILSYELYPILTFYYDILPKELLLKVSSSPNIDYKEETKLLNLFDIDTNNKNIVIFLIKNRYPSIYNLIRELNLLSNVSIKLYEELTEFQDYLEWHADNYGEYYEDKFVGDIFKMVTHSGDFKLEDTDPIIITLILYEKYIHIYNIISTDDYLRNKMKGVLKDIIIIKREADSEDAGLIFESLELSDAIYEFVEDGEIYVPEFFMHLENDIVSITELINDHPLLWVFLLSIDLSNLLYDQNTAATKIISRLRGIDTKEYSFSNKFLNKIRSENKKLYEELNHI